ncbi:MAG: ATP-binding protein [Cyanothece sp. SIO2G6]|nr:ATP-binding protein [Cyanothece sp. SIO2G6]
MDDLGTLKQEYEQHSLDVRVMHYLDMLSERSRNQPLNSQERFILQGSLAKIGYEDLSRISSECLEKGVQQTTLKINGAKLFEWLTTVLDEDVSKVKIVKLYQTLQERIQDGGIAALLNQGESKSVFFYGRGQELSKLKSYCEICSIVSVVGMTGIGKTTLVREYVQRQNPFGTQHWIASPQTFFKEVEATGTREMAGLYIFDPFTNALFQQYAPLIEKLSFQSDVRLLFVTTQPLVGVAASHLMLPLKGLPVADAIKIPIEFGLGEEPWSAIVQTLGGHPRFIRQYASWAKEHRVGDAPLLNDLSVQLGFFETSFCELFAQSASPQDKAILLAIAQSEQGLSLLEVLTQHKRSAKRLDYLVNSGILALSDESPGTIKYTVPAVLKKYVLEMFAPTSLNGQLL